MSYKAVQHRCSCLIEEQMHLLFKQYTVLYQTIDCPLLDVTKSYNAKFWLIRVHSQAHIKNPTASRRGWGLQGELFTPILIPPWGSLEGHLQHLQALVYVGEIFCHMNSKGSEVWPLVLQKTFAILCMEIMGFILFHSHIHGLQTSRPIIY